QRVSVEELLHVSVEPLAWPVPPARALSLVERNGNTLAAIAALEERRVDNAEDDNPLVQEMRRMDAKLTALVDIVSRAQIEQIQAYDLQLQALLGNARDAGARQWQRAHRRSRAIAACAQL
ncbi:MAG TPA: hypothetical protein VFE77_09370, partial [Rhodanobacter sp.]|nr:hypothetical protein [Rhodanobacter sp.]